MTTTDQPTFEFQPNADGTLTLENAVFQALGSASASWENLSGAGEFQSERASDAGKKLIEHITAMYRQIGAAALEEAANKIGPYPIADPAITDPATGEYVPDSSMAIMLAPDGEDASIVRGYLRHLADQYRQETFDD